MSSSAFLRSCFCSLLVICFVIDASAQRRGVRRSVSTTVKTDTVQLEFRGIGCGYMNTNVEVIDEKRIKTPECRETKLINKPNITDAYPFLSEDGLRLYFTSNPEGGHGRFYISTRKSVNDPFGEPTVLSKHLTDGYYAGTLTADELTLCMVMSGDMYISVRKSVNDIFPAPVKMTGADDIYHFGPSISADGTEIVVTVSIGNKDRTRIYKRTGTYQVSNPKNLALPSEGEPGPGQLSKDGLQYYLSIETETSEHLWRYSRASLSENFSNLEELPEQMKGLKNILQPTLNKDGSVIAFVTAPSDTWSEDDILLVNTDLKEEEPVLIKPSTELFTYSLIAKKLEVKLPVPEPTMPNLKIPFSPRRYSCGLGLSLMKMPPIKNEPKNENIVVAKKEIPVQSSLHVKVYPNPFATSLHIEIDKLPGSGAIFNLYDISGKKIRQEQINNTQTTISLDQFIPGIYSYQLMNKKGELLSSGNLIKAE